MDNPHVWDMPHHPTYLWTLPMFHCNGWCFPWGITAQVAPLMSCALPFVVKIVPMVQTSFDIIPCSFQAGTHVCLRSISARNIHHAFADHGVTHLCGAPIIMSLIANAEEEDRKPFQHQVQMMTAAASPPAAVLEKMQRMGIEVSPHVGEWTNSADSCSISKVTHVYGLTEVYGPATICAWKPEWSTLPAEQQACRSPRPGWQRLSP